MHVTRPMLAICKSIEELQFSVHQAIRINAGAEALFKAEISSSFHALTLLALIAMDDLSHPKRTCTFRVGFRSTLLAGLQKCRQFAAVHRQAIRVSETYSPRIVSKQFGERLCYES